MSICSFEIYSLWSKGFDVSDDIAFCNLTSKDVVRHPLVQKIVKAYDNYEQREQKKSSGRNQKNGR